jgi:hypothetical protein
MENQSIGSFSQTLPQPPPLLLHHSIVGLEHQEVLADFATKTTAAAAAVAAAACHRPGPVCR